MPVKLTRTETAVFAFVHRQAARVLMDQLLDQLQVSATLRWRFQQLRFVFRRQHADAATAASGLHQYRITNFTRWHR